MTKVRVIGEHRLLVGYRNQRVVSVSDEAKTLRLGDQVRVLEGREVFGIESGTQGLVVGLGDPEFVPTRQIVTVEFGTVPGWHYFEFQNVVPELVPTLESELALA